MREHKSTFLFVHHFKCPFLFNFLIGFFLSNFYRKKTKGKGGKEITQLAGEYIAWDSPFKFFPSLKKNSNIYQINIPKRNKIYCR